VAIVITPGRDEQQDFPHPEYYAIPRHQTIGAKAIRRLTIASVLHNLD